VQTDPEPQRNRFIRSDQYSFIREGVPALAFKVAFEPNSPEAKISAEWTREPDKGMELRVNLELSENLRISKRLEDGAVEHRCEVDLTGCAVAKPKPN